MPKLTLDVCYCGSETLEDALKYLTINTDLTATVIDPHGPGGGWPVVEFNGTHQDLALLATRYCAVENRVVDSILNHLNPIDRAVVNAVNEARDLLEWIKE